VAEARNGRCYEDEAYGTALDGLARSRGNGNRRVVAPHSSSAGRLSKCPAAVFLASNPVASASVPTTAPHLPASGCGGRQAQAPEVQVLTNRFRPYRHSEAQKAEGKLYLSVGIDRTVKFAIAQHVDTAERKKALEFFQHLLEAVP